jgi:hypothetical protein
MTGVYPSTTPGMRIRPDDDCDAKDVQFDLHRQAADPNVRKAIPASTTAPIAAQTTLITPRLCQVGQRD